MQNKNIDPKPETTPTDPVELNPSELTTADGPGPRPGDKNNPPRP